MIKHRHVCEHSAGSHPLCSCLCGLNSTVETHIHMQQYGVQGRGPVRAKLLSPMFKICYASYSTFWSKIFSSNTLYIYYCTFY